MKRSVNFSRQRKPPKASQLANALALCGIGKAEAREILTRMDRIDGLMDAERGTSEGAELDKLVDDQIEAEKGVMP